ncbi:MAG: sulfatase [Longimicrobiales bacterium]
MASGWIALIGIWFALAGGLVEAGRVAVLLLLDRFVWLPFHALWLPPLANLAFFTLPILALALLPWLTGSDRSRLAAVFVFAFLACFGLLNTFGWHLLNAWGAAGLALGLAIQITRMTRQRWQRFEALVARTLALFLALVIAAAAGTGGWRLVTQRNEMAALTGTVPSGSRNILLIILDTVRAQSMSLYGYERLTTPHLDRWAAQGVTFDHAIATSSWTLPTHASLFTGREAVELETNWKVPLDRRFPRVAEAFRDAGYLTAGFVANLLYTGHDSGLARGFLEYRDYKWTWRQWLLTAGLGQRVKAWRAGWQPYHPFSDRKDASEVNKEFLHWLDGADERPFFVFLNYYDAHQPYRPPSEYRRRFRHENRGIEGYDGALAYLDDQLHLLLTALERRDVLENTVVVVTSDHGEMFGEQDLTGHGNSLYMPVLRVPLFVWGPGIPAGMRVDNVVSVRTLAQTLTELAGLDAEFSGESLNPYWRDLSEAGDVRRNDVPALAALTKGIRTPPEWPVSKGDMASVIRGDWQYIQNGDGTELLFDIVRDPGQAHDLSGLPSMAGVMAELRSELRRAQQLATADHARK